MILSILHANTLECFFTTSDEIMTKQYEFTHRRKNLLNGEWVLVSPHRNNRPWSGATETQSQLDLPSYDEKCPLCAGNTRANGESNPDYAYTHVFKNDFGALTETLPEDASVDNDDLFQADLATGEARVICFSPDHSKTLAEVAVNEINHVVDTWQQQYQELSQRYRCVHLFENKGEMMGCSQPHPHGQVWAHNHYSTEIAREEQNQLAYFDKHKRALLDDYATREISEKSRVVFENEAWLVVVPYWAKWPFETLLLTKQNHADFNSLDERSKYLLSEAIHVLTSSYDNVFNCSFPYSMGWHNAPSDIETKEHWRLHAHFYPPLLRSATVKKHMVGYEMLAESQRDLTAETAAKILRDARGTHYKQNTQHLA